MCLGRVLHSRILHLPDWQDWCDLPYCVPRRQQSEFRHLGRFVACLEQSRHGLHLVRRPILDWWHLRLLDDPEHLAFLGRFW